jgi:hypothetical protein
VIPSPTLAEGLQTPDPSLLSARGDSDTISTSPFDWRALAQLQIMVLQTQLNFWRKQVGQYPKCKHCGCEIR